ncbi:hypothetical protein M2333_001305 [Sphingobium sp. B11D3B]|uniref:hypothetical protein n=1 Tax=Sphingobium sp. B11D3B TaxID=2940575 RepID=UPI0022274D86|nr:hypothetical protein [Sphingobium sp. B11D3B]MCW2388259.1 hypothetical protein [Sphingobium sp. B11D3B]
MLAFIFTVSAIPVGTPTLVDLMILTKPYVDCRSTADQNIIALQQKIQSKIYEDGNYDRYVDPDYHDLNEEISKAEKVCDLPRFISLVRNAISFSASYDDYQKQKLAEFVIRDIMQLQWTFLNARSGTYNFPKMTAIPLTAKRADEAASVSSSAQNNN